MSEVFEKYKEEHSDNYPLCWSMQYAPKLSHVKPSDLPKKKPRRMMKAERKVRFSFMERVDEEDEESTFRLPPLDGLRGGIGRARVSRGISYLIPANEGKVSIQNTYDPDLSALFKRPYNDDVSSLKKTLRPTSKSVNLSSNNTRVLRGGGGVATLEPLQGASVRLRRSSIQINPEVREMLNSFAKCAPYDDPVEPDNRSKLIAAKKRRESNQSEPAYLSEAKADMIWKWLKKENDERYEKQTNADAWMYELP